MGFKIDTRKGGSGALFYVMLALMVYALVSVIIAWQTLDKCGDSNSAKNWQVYPPGWVCK